MLQKSMKIRQIQNRQKAKSAESQKKKKKKCFPKELLENTDLYKPVLNKIMTTK